MKNIPSNIFIVTISHSHVDIEVPLEEWIKTGPGPRIYVKPIALQDKHTGNSLPLRRIPFRYRNNKLSRLLISLGLISKPWNDNEMDK